MRDGVQTLGWFLRRVPDTEALIAWYRDVFGLPLLRRGPTHAMFWAGECQTFEVNLGGGPPPPHYTDRDQAPCVPIFRVHNIQGWIDKLAANGARFVNDMPREHNRLAYFVDPSGHVTGLQERYRSSDRAEDREAWRRWDEGTLTLPGADPLPDGLQHMGWNVLRVTDVEAEVAFYQNVVGLDVAVRYPANALLSMGDGVLLEIAPGCPPQPPVSSRTEVSNVSILRAHDLDGIVADLKAKGVRFVDDIFSIVGGRLAYFADPEGHVMGLGQRGTDSPRIEDQVADQIWAQRG